jgi:hypothetical protein
MVTAKHNSSGKLRSFKAISLAASLMIALTPATACLAADPQLNFKIYSPQGESEAPVSAPTTTPSASADKSIFDEESPKIDETQSTAPAKETKAAPSPIKEESAAADAAASTPAEMAKPEESASKLQEEKATEEVSVPVTEPTETVAKSEKTLQGYIRVVPTGTKIPIIMDTAVDSDTSQEGDEFSARTAEDLTIDGNTAVPAGSIIKGRIAQMNASRALNRSGSVALKFDTITTPDNRQIPLVANIVARGGVVHARRGLKDIAIDTGAVAAPMLAGLAIGALAGGSKANSTTTTTTTSHKLGRAGGAMVGVGVGLAVGVIILLAKKGKKVEVRPGDELKIELAEDLRMPTM